MAERIFENQGYFVWNPKFSKSGFWVYAFETTWKGRKYPKIGITEVYKDENGFPRLKLFGLSEGQKKYANYDINSVTLSPRAYIELPMIPQVVAAISNLYAHLTNSTVSEDLHNPPPPPNVVLRPLSPSDTEVPPKDLPGPLRPLSTPDTPINTSSSNIDQLVNQGNSPELDPMVQAYLKENLPD